jgi:hypothetical protein
MTDSKFLFAGSGGGGAVRGGTPDRPVSLPRGPGAARRAQAAAAVQSDYAAGRALRPVSRTRRPRV